MRIVLTGGRSGGHFYPLIAVAEGIEDICKERTLLEPELFYVGPPPFDREILMEHDIVYKASPAGKIHRYSKTASILGFFPTVVGVVKSIFQLFHLYPDVVPALHAWNESGLDVRIFSSGSVAAQLAFFSHTHWGDLLPQFRGHYDTTLGPKREPASYHHIADLMGLSPGKILFVSDIPAELDAAQAAGFQTGLSIRPGNAPVEKTCDHPRISSFAEIRILQGTR